MAWSAALVAGSILVTNTAAAQEISRYRDDVLGSSVASVMTANGLQASDLRILHDRPGLIQQALWRAPHVASPELSSDAVRDVAYSFHDGTLYQIVVNYDRRRTEGMTGADVVEAVSAEYGPGVRAGQDSWRDLPPEALPGSVVLARWQDSDALLTLVQSEAAPEFQLILISKSLGRQALRAIREAARLAVIEGPRREQQRRHEAMLDAAAARDKARVENKAAFRP